MHPQVYQFCVLFSLSTTALLIEPSTQSNSVVPSLECAPQHHEVSSSSNGTVCGRVLAKGICWPEATANLTTVEPCPGGASSGHHPARLAFRHCYVSPETGELMFTIDDRQCQATGYGNVGDNNKTIENESWQSSQMVREAISLTGYFCSLLFLSMALAIFRVFKHETIGLDLATTKLHSQLFVSFILRAVMHIIKHFTDKVSVDFDPATMNLRPEDVKSFSVMDLEGDFHYMSDDERVLFAFMRNYNTDQPQMLCKAITFLWQYSLLANYSWIMVEAIYLVRILVKPLSKPHRLLVYICIGWLLPLVFIIPWAIFRQLYANSYCWTLSLSSTSIIFFTIRVPTLATILVTFICFIFIFWSVVNKMFIDRQTRQHYTTLNLLKSTSVLIVIFGVHYFICSFFNIRENGDTLIEEVMFYYDLTFTSFQGMIVAYVYCLQNAQVRQECRRRFNQRFGGRRSTASVSYSSNTQEVTISEEVKEDKNKSRLNSIAFEEASATAAANIPMQTFAVFTNNDANV